MTNAIGQWNPAWGPEPVKAEDRPVRAAWGGGRKSYKSDWHLVTCPRSGCRNHEGALIYAPKDSGGRGLGENYVCAICGCQMRQERVKRVQRR